MTRKQSLTLDDLARDPTARVVTEEEATHLEARNREIDAQRAAERRKQREASAVSNAAKRARLAPYRAALMALEPGQHCVIPSKEFALVYRVANETGRVLTAEKQGDGNSRIVRTDKGAAEGLM